MAAQTLTHGAPQLANPLQPFLSTQGTVVLDGALATELERRGADLHDSLWSAKLLVEDPLLIKAVHAAYLQAGADVITTASYQATVQGFMARGLSQPAAEDLIRLSVDLAVEARDEFWANEANRSGRLRPLVAASVGPFGAYLADGSEYSGDYALSQDALVDFHRPRLAILAASAADLLAFETIPSLLEAQAIVALLQEFPQLPAWISFSCRDGVHVSHGERLSACAAVADASPSVVAVGINCTAPDFIESLVVEAAAGTDKPIAVYPNSGEGWDSEAGEWVGEGEANRLDAYAPVWREAGARLVGGCCRTKPADILAVRAAILPA